MEGRGRFYEEVGAIRDVVQNHLLEVVALLTMEAPVGDHPDALRDKKQRAFRAMRPLATTDVVRGQFRGYRNEDGVAADSHVETFAAIRLSIDTPRWAGVPFYIRAGKRLPLTATEVRVEFKRPPQAVFDTASARERGLHALSPQPERHDLVGGAGQAARRSDGRRGRRVARAAHGRR